MIKKTSALPDLLITIPMILLLSLGILVIYSSDPKLAIQQGIFALVGLSLYWFLSLIDFEYYQQYAKYPYLLTLILLLVVFVVGIETRGSLRWIQLAGWQIQPSEFAKPALILFLANFWSKRLITWLNIIKSFLLILPVVGLVFKQPDLGTTLTIFMIWLVIVIGANISFFKVAVISLGSVILTPLVWAFLKDYQKERIIGFLSPNQDPLGTGYNAIQSTIAVGSGGFWGWGLGRGTQSRLQFLPEFRTDFIFASIAEELGFIASAAVLFLYGILIAESIKIISNTEDRFSSLLIFGVLGMIFFQVMVNIGMNIGVMPVTGITLPLLSYGGSSLLVTLVSLSFVASVSRFKRKKTVEG